MCGTISAMESVLALYPDGIEQDFEAAAVALVR